MQVYMVGGAVRDTLLGIEPKDKDYVVVGATPADMKKLGYSQVGSSFPVFLHPETGEEYALARTERKTGVGYNGFDVVYDPTVTLEQDLVRRDLTINSIAIDTDGNIIDPYNGQKDLNDRILRHTSEAFAEDPVRVLRTARFAARYSEFTVAQETIDLMRIVAPELEYVPKERIWAEFEKGLSEEYPSRMMYTLERANVFSVGCMRPYIDWKIYAEALDRATYVPVRFALISSRFTSEDFRTMCIPSDAAMYSELLHGGTGAAASFYVTLSSEEKLSLLEQLRVFSSDQKLIALVHVLAPFDEFSHVHESMALLHTDVEKLRTGIDTAKIASQYSNGKEIAGAIRRARLELLERR